jgi:peroxiredoxin
MKIPRPLTLVISLAFAAAAVASPEEAQRIRKKWDLASETWNLEMRAATTPDQAAKAAAHKPDLAIHAREMWNQISGSLDKDWTLEPASWFLRATPGLLTNNPDGSATLTFTKEIETIRKAVETHHLNSPKLTPMCMAMVTAKDPRALATLEKIQEKHPDQKIQGVAALASAMLLKTLSDDTEALKKRITYLRKAIIQSVAVDLGGTTVGNMAEDELYLITHLSKDRVAPDLAGTDSAGRAIKLSGYQGKVVMLLFWNSMMDNAQEVMKLMAETDARMKGKPFVLLGINNDTIEKLRMLEGNDTVTIKSLSDPDNKLANAYRIGTRPMIYVLDGERRIHYTGAPGSFAELTAEALLANRKP